jgi:hypothetical protein
MKNFVGMDVSFGRRFIAFIWFLKETCNPSITHTKVADNKESLRNFESRGT